MGQDQCRLVLPAFIDGLSVEKLEIKVREIAQESPLREVFAAALLVAFQKQLEAEVPNLTPTRLA